MSPCFDGVVTFRKPGLVLVFMNGFLVNVSRGRVRVRARVRSSSCFCRGLGEKVG